MADRADRKDQPAVTPGGSEPGDPPDLGDLETVDPRDLDTLPSGPPRASGREPGPARALRAGSRLGSYRLEHMLGEGGFGQVWQAVDEVSSRAVAIKVLTATRAASADALERFQREGRVAAALSHPHCVCIFSAEQVDGFPAITMELMPGGTLQDRLDKAGPLAVSEAVDYILDVMNGLEAAAERGILHRDVKPSNIFLDETGRAKIGDFGLSKSLAGDATLTATGAYLGTPCFSSPEQVRGRDIDLRSDIYAVGATLYALLTARPPFEASNAGEVLARILSEPPIPFAARGVAVPRPLARIVARAMHKDPARRFASYAALRAALLPFSSRLGLSPADLGQRALAWVGDNLLMGLVSKPIEIFTVMRLIGDAPRLAMVLQAVLYFAVMAGYFVLTEVRWQGSPAKRLLGLRVVGAAGAPPTPGAVTVRALLLAGVYYGPYAAVVWLTPLSLEAASGLKLACLVALLVTMRRANGHAGIHELLSGTRVTSPERHARLTVPEGIPLGGEPIDGTVGPYRLTGRVWVRDGEELLVGRDDRLERDVWIHRRTGAGGRSPERLPRVGSGRGSLTWLQGAAVAEGRWDAYAAPSGVGVVDWVRSRGRLGWAETAPILAMLAAALARRGTGEEPARPGSLRHLWLEASGQLLWLDFPVTLDAMVADPEEAPTIGGSTELLCRAARFLLTGQPTASERPLADTALPESVAPLVRRLVDDAAEVGPLAEVASGLAVAARRPTRVSQRRRLGPLAVVWAPLLFALAITPLALAFLRHSPDLRDLVMGKAYLRALQELEAGPTSGDPAVRERREALRLLLARSYTVAASSGSVTSDLEKLHGEDRRTLETALRGYSEPSADELSAAREVVEHHYPDLQVEELPGASELLGAMTAASVLAPIGVVLAWLVRGGPLLRAFGIRVQAVDARPAGRLRCLARALVAWSPFLAMWLARKAPLAGAPHHVLDLALVGMAVAGTVYALARPERGLPDLAVGTRLVPR